VSRGERGVDLYAEQLKYEYVWQLTKRLSRFPKLVIRSARKVRNISRNEMQYIYSIES